MQISYIPTPAQRAQDSANASSGGSSGISITPWTITAVGERLLFNAPNPDNSVEIGGPGDVSLVVLKGTDGNQYKLSVAVDENGIPTTQLEAL